MSATLSPIIEYLLTRRIADHYVCQQTISQTEIPRLPAGTTIDYAMLPAGSDYAAIAYEAEFDPAMVPGAIFAYEQHYNNRLYSGPVTNWLTTNTIGSFIIISGRMPAYLRIRNQTNMDQYYAGTIFLLSIATEEDYNLIIEELRRVDRTEEHAIKANELMTKMVKALQVIKKKLPGDEEEEKEEKGRR